MIKNKNQYYFFSHKVLLAIDDFNGCFVPKSFKLDKTEWVSSFN